MKYLLIGIKLKKKIIRKKKNNKSKKKNNKSKKKNYKIMKGGQDATYYQALIISAFENGTPKIDPKKYSTLNFTKGQKNINHYLKPSATKPTNTNKVVLDVEGKNYEIHTIPSDLIDTNKLRQGDDLNMGSAELKTLML